MTAHLFTGVSGITILSKFTKSYSLNNNAGHDTFRKMTSLRFFFQTQIQSEVKITIYIICFSSYNVCVLHLSDIRMDWLNASSLFLASTQQCDFDAITFGNFSNSL